MRIAIYLPNLTRASGGAEVYLLNLAKVLSKRHEIVIIAAEVRDSCYSPEKVYKKYGFPRFKTCYIRFLFEDPGKSIVKEFLKERTSDCSVNILLKKLKPDLFINGTQAKIIFRGGCRSAHIIHFPIKRYRFRILKNMDVAYIRSYDLLVSNSEFTRRHLKRIYGKDSVLLYPPVAFPLISKTGLGDKENIILAVDRLVPDKKIIEMIGAFKALRALTDERYIFVIAGNRDKKEKAYYEKVEKAVREDADIELHCDISSEELLSLYRRARIFWHAKGYQVDGDDPEQMEHFGMTTAEAMTNGCIPVVIGKAGQKEIMHGKLRELTWQSLDELTGITRIIIEDKERMQKLQEKVISEAEKYQYPVFEKRAAQIFSGLCC